MTPNDTPIVEVKHLTKSFQQKKALDGLSFDVHAGEILCFLGPNGAGKSTVINILSTALSYDRGEISFQGEKVENVKARFKRQLGIVPQDLAIYEDVSAEKNVRFFASLYGLRGKVLNERVAKALAFVGLTARKNDKPKTFSGGMKRRLNIACAIAHEPQVIIMDEPTVGIDPQSRHHILQSIKQLRKTGTTVIYTTHYMEEVEEISSRIVIIDHGKIIAEGTKQQLKERLAKEKLYRVAVDDVKRVPEDELFRIEGVKKVAIKGELIEVATLAGVENLDKIIVCLMNNGRKINNITSVAPSLEMVFLNLTGRTLRN
ncbi:ABC transporter ATP-binding protein [Numidum massiliense]|uniref:ABC transporter ATP-binding protein n=1 Tax=Numidum massiliense TaxID=1522315 RepID=UPI0006D56639|nr:ABC transporter ATP-binding protein [Numidum massiliense]